MDVVKTCGETLGVTQEMDALLRVKAELHIRFLQCCFSYALDVLASKGPAKYRDITPSS